MPLRPGRVMSSVTRSNFRRAELSQAPFGVLGLKALEAVVGEPAGDQRSHVGFVVNNQRSFGWRDEGAVFQVRTGQNAGSSR